MPALPFKPPAVVSRNLPVALRGLADNPSAPPAVLLRLAAADTARSTLARRRDLPTEVAAVLAGDEDAGRRAELAAHPALPDEVLLRLARDADPGVRGRLAKGVEYFTSVGVQERHVPRPLSSEAYELLARDPDPEVRRALAFNRHLPEDLRIRLLDDEDPRTAAAAATEWDPAPAARIDDLLARALDDRGRFLLLLRLDGPLPHRTARALLADIDSAAERADGPDLLPHIAATADLDAELTERFMADRDPELRAALASNPTLAPGAVTALTRDPDNEVRAAVVCRRDLDPVRRESMAVTFDDESSGRGPAWLLRAELSEPEQLALARSRHQVLRKTLALRAGLSDEVVGILSEDESFVVRLFVCERQPNAPAALLARTAADWTSYSRWDMLAHPNFPARAATALAHSDESQDRAVAAAHPGLPLGTVEALLVDDTERVRHRAATNPSLPAARLIALLAAEDAAHVSGAATNRALTVEAMTAVLDQAGR
ncbi:hypothetical protein [Streptomyces sp. NPDC097619]|uniref:hypothetical protein n=1 Tax=Streptomyces sp. NPDC097619 TaxID=3157228 RepID=UPI0033317532